jgi:hypothetical protein
MWGSMFTDSETNKDRGESIFQLFLIVLGGFLLLFLAWPSFAQERMFAGRTTPDISIAATSTRNVFLFSTPSRWTWIKNDCADDLYFDLRGSRDSVDNPNNAYPLMLKNTETFEWKGHLYSLGVSHGSASTASCTFTLITAQ